MSSALLYLAIVAIWAIVLVPRWLRQPYAQSGTAADADAGFLPAEEADSELVDGFAEAAMTEGHHAVGGGLDDEPAAEQAAAPFVAVAAPGPGAPRHGAASARERRPVTRTATRARPAPTALPSSDHAAGARRARVLQARRRTLSTLVLLTAGAVGIAAAQLAAWWVIIPPAALLVFFVLLLRTAARIDTQRAHQTHLHTAPAAYAVAAQGTAGQGTAGQGTAGQTDGGTARAAGQPTHAPQPVAWAPAAPAAASGEPEPSAEIIDISGRVEDQLYDQYSDAEARAVGD